MISSSLSSPPSSCWRDSSRRILKWEKVRKRPLSSLLTSLLFRSSILTFRASLSCSRDARRSSSNRLRWIPCGSQNHLRLVASQQVLRSLHSLEDSRSQRDGKAATRVPRLRPVDLERRVSFASVSDKWTDASTISIPSSALVRS